MRRQALLVLVVAAPAAADPTALTPEQAKVLETKGYKSPVLVFDSAALRVASAKKAGRTRLVIVTGDNKVVDAGNRGAGTLTIAPTKSALVAPAGVTQLEVSYETPRTDGSNRSGSLWIVRTDGSIACRVTGSSSNSIDKGCGSSGWTSARPTLKADASGGITLDIRYENSGNFSEPDGKGGCLNRSPVRSAQLVRWVIPAKGTCKKGTAPKKLDDDPGF
jgi:hypothetical protein